MGSKTVLITGGSRGIGAAAVRAFAQAGYAVALNYCRSRDAALRLAEELTAQGHIVLPVQADVSDPDQVRHMVDNVLDNFCQLDILICNAGTAWRGLLCDLTDQDWHRLRGTDLDGVLYCCRAVYRHMVSRKQGRILTVSSMWGRSGASCEAAYSAAKAGVIGLTQALARELGPSGITVNCVAPGVIDTEMNAGLTPEDLQALSEETPLGRLGTPEDVARALLFLASPEAGFLTGQVLGVDGGYL
ncbi:MAG TPA: 3-oxoacyl-ACP reductase FabG [Candidatus Intestinimonas pullistercoris]|uniref:3-oxoacyl-ACP reductase FabG n=1 Tax=Candidatus Intestinimonas pullistercoris TaxID=2838623 RepID=A0A9D2NZV9_9FIRM|nr:3-oxoacyl-ACP reductase FabG [uncultured Intestinimonas sp.]HJC41766.1 3-oxoacyl-ACP reductase FabG [Candidatus Intestinimonas pullistercoris]